jgi:hypothetical protein
MGAARKKGPKFSSTGNFFYKNWYRSDYKEILSDWRKKNEKYDEDYYIMYQENNQNNYKAHKEQYKYQRAFSKVAGAISNGLKASLKHKINKEHPTGDENTQQIELAYRNYFGKYDEMMSPEKPPDPMAKSKLGKNPRVIPLLNLSELDSAFGNKGTEANRSTQSLH